MQPSPSGRLRARRFSSASARARYYRLLDRVEAAVAAPSTRRADLTVEQLAKKDFRRLRKRGRRMRFSSRPWRRHRSCREGSVRLERERWATTRTCEPGRGGRPRLQAKFVTARELLLERLRLRRALRVRRVRPARGWTSGPGRHARARALAALAAVLRRRAP